MRNGLRANARGTKGLLEGRRLDLRRWTRRRKSRLGSGDS